MGDTDTTMLRELFMLDMLDTRGAAIYIFLSLTQNTIINITTTMTREKIQMN